MRCFAIGLEFFVLLPVVLIYICLDKSPVWDVAQTNFAYYINIVMLPQKFLVEIVPSKMVNFVVEFRTCFAMVYLNHSNLYLTAKTCQFELLPQQAGFSS